MNRYLASLATSTAIALAICPTVRAETMLIVPGTRSELFGVFPLPGVAIPGYPASVGSGFYPDADVTVIDYPASSWPLSGLNTPTVGASVVTGAANLDTAIKAADGPVLVTGASQGAMVINREQDRLANDPDAPPPDQLKFIVFSDPQRGVFSTLLPEGTYIPIVDFQTRAPLESQYDTILVVAEYDGWADFPDRPWNLVSVANALMGAATVHGTVALVDPTTVPPENVTVTTNSKGATTTTYLVPTEHLPLTQPLRNLGVNERIVDNVDKFLRPIVNAGYSRNDDAAVPQRPYVSHGEIRINKPAADPAIQSVATTPDPEPEAPADKTQEPQRDTSKPQPEPAQRTTATLNDKRRADRLSERDDSGTERQQTRQQDREEHDGQKDGGQKDDQ